MEFAIQSYINNNLDLHAKAVYQEPRWLASTAVDASTRRILIPVNKNANVRFILVSYLQLAVSQDTSYTLVDDAYPGVTIMRATGSRYSQNITPFCYLVKSNTLSLTLTNGLAGDFTYFSIMYQFISQEKEK